MMVMCNDILHTLSIFQRDKCKRFVLNSQGFITKSSIFLSFSSNRRLYFIRFHITMMKAQLLFRFLSGDTSWLDYSIRNIHIFFPRTRSGRPPHTWPLSSSFPSRPDGTDRQTSLRAVRHAVPYRKSLRHSYYIGRCICRTVRRAAISLFVCFSFIKVIPRHKST